MEMTNKRIALIVGSAVAVGILAHLMVGKKRVHAAPKESSKSDTPLVPTPAIAAIDNMTKPEMTKIMDETNDVIKPEILNITDMSSLTKPKVTF